MITWRKQYTDKDLALREAHRQQREALKRLIIDEIDSLCECCDWRQGFDLHEVFVKRSDLPIERHGEIFVRGNCALVCPECHRDNKVAKEEFIERFKSRLVAMGYEPFSLLKGERTNGQHSVVRL